MAGPATQAGSAAGGIIEGFLGGVEAGEALRDRRTARQFAVDDRLREQIAAKLTADRQAVLDSQRAAERAEDAARFQEETGLAPDTGPAAPTGAAPPALPGLPQGVMDLRADVGRAIGQEGVPEGFKRVQPAAEDIEQERLTGLRTGVADFISASPEERERMLQDPATIEALQEGGILGGVVSRREAAAQPDPTSPLQRMTGQGGLEFTFDPRGEVGERVAPLLGPSGEQFVSRQTPDNFARQNAQAAMNAISRIDPFAFSEAEALLEPDRVAQRFGFTDVAQAQQILSAAVGGGEAEAVVDVEARASELRALGLTTDEVIAKLREEGLISG